MHLRPGLLPLAWKIISSQAPGSKRIKWYTYCVPVTNVAIVACLQFMSQIPTELSIILQSKADQLTVSPSATSEFQGHTFLQGEDKGIGTHKKAGHIDIKQSLERQAILP